MPAKQEVTFVIRARDLTRTAFGRVRRSISRLGRSLASLPGLIGVGALIAGFKNATERVRELDAAVQRTGINANRLAALQTVFQGFGVNQEQFLQIFDKLAETRARVLDGNEELEESFNALGVTAQQLQIGNLDTILQSIADALSADTNNTLADELQRLVGEIGARATPALKQGAAEINAAAGKLERSGIGEDLVDQAEAARQLAAETAQLQANLQNLLTELIPAVRDATKAINDAVEFFQRPDVEVAEDLRENIRGVPVLGTIADVSESTGLASAIADAALWTKRLSEQMAENAASEAARQAGRR